MTDQEAQILRCLTEVAELLRDVAKHNEQLTSFMREYFIGQQEPADYSSASMIG